MYHQGVGYTGSINQLYKYLELNGLIEVEAFTERLNKLIKDGLIFANVSDKVYKTKIYNFYSNTIKEIEAEELDEKGLE